MKNRKKRFLAVLPFCFLCLFAAGCGCGKEKDEKEEKVMTITITPEPTPTPAPEEVNPDAVVKNGNIMMVNPYLAEEKAE